jgi:hypothetical protein
MTLTATWTSISRSRWQGVRRIDRRKHKRRNNLVISCRLRLALRLLYFCSLRLRGHFFFHPPSSYLEKKKRKLLHNKKDGWNYPIACPAYGTKIVSSGFSRRACRQLSEGGVTQSRLFPAQPPGAERGVLRLVSSSGSLMLVGGCDTRVRSLWGEGRPHHGCALPLCWGLILTDIGCSQTTVHYQLSSKLSVLKLRLLQLTSMNPWFWSLQYNSHVTYCSCSADKTSHIYISNSF